MENFQVRAIKDSEQIKTVLDLFSDSLKSLSQGEMFRVKMSKKFAATGNVFVIEDEKIYGFCACYMNDVLNKVAFISMFATLPNNRGIGIGSKMMEYIVNVAKQNDMQMIRLQVDKGNDTP